MSIQTWTCGGKRIVAEGGVVTHSDCPDLLGVGQKVNADLLRRAGWKKEKAKAQKDVWGRTIR